jgi:TonB family protein
MARCLLLPLIIFLSGQVSAQDDPPPVEENIDWGFDSLAVQEEKKVYEMFDIRRPSSFPGGDRAAKKFFSEEISYPFKQWIMGQEGKVYVTFVTGTSGDIKDVQLEKSSLPIFNQKALKAIRNLPKFMPPDMGGHPEDCLFRYVVEFRKPSLMKSKIVVTLYLLATKNRNATEWRECFDY